MLSLKFEKGATKARKKAKTPKIQPGMRGVFAEYASYFELRGLRNKYGKSFVTNFPSLNASWKILQKWKHNFPFLHRLVYSYPWN